MKTLLGSFLMAAQATPAASTKNTNPDIVLPGKIGINLSSRTIVNSDKGIRLDLSDITDASVCYAGRSGFVDSYVLALETKRYDNPKLKWRISNSEREADQVALIVKDVLSGDFSPADCAKLPENIKALTQRFAGSC